MVSPLEITALAQAANLSSSDGSGEEERESLRKEAKKERDSKDKELREVHKRQLERERDFQTVLVKTSAAIAEHKTKVEMISKFINGVGSYSEIQAKYNQEIANLECVIDGTKKDLQPFINEVEKLEEDVSNLLFLYRDKNKMFDEKYRELKLLIDEKEILVKDKAFKLIGRKKQELDEMEEDIVDLEIKVLNKELARLNKVIDIQPRQDLLNEQILSLKFLRNEKSNKEMSSLYLMLSGKGQEIKKNDLEVVSNDLVIDASVIKGDNSHQTLKQKRITEEEL